MLKHDLTGKTFGMLLVVEKGTKRDASGERAWICQCKCGQEKQVRSWQLRSGKTKSCGCKGNKGVRTHGKSRHSGSTGDEIYGVWALMHQRCSDKLLAVYKYYGGRGISVCSRWSSFEAFLEDMGARPDGHSIDRIDVEGGYEPSNCRWATPRQQANNRRNSKYIDFMGLKLTVAEWARAAGLSYSGFARRLAKGEVLPEALRPPSCRTGGEK